MSDDLRRDPLHIEDVLAGRRDPGEVDPDALSAARAQEQRFKGEVLPRTMDAVVARTRHRPFIRPMGLAFTTAISAAVAIVLVTAPWEVESPARNPREPEPAEDSYVGVRGGPTLDLRVRREGQVHRWAPGESMRCGDELRLIPHGREYGWLLVFAVAEEGGAQVVVPFEGSRSRRIDEDGLPLDGSLVLDEAPGREALVALFSREPLDAAEAAELVGGSLEQRTEAGSKALRDGAVVVVEIPFDKETR